MEDLKLHDFDEFEANEELINKELLNQTTFDPQTPPSPIQTPSDCQPEQNDNNTDKNWNFYNLTQNTRPYSTKGNTNKTPSSAKLKNKRKSLTKTQRNSRRVNRKK